MSQIKWRWKTFLYLYPESLESYLNSLKDDSWEVYQISQGNDGNWTIIVRKAM
jgi:hypothetical protein